MVLERMKSVFGGMENNAEADQRAHREMLQRVPSDAELRFQTDTAADLPQPEANLKRAPSVAGRVLQGSNSPRQQTLEDDEDVQDDAEITAAAAHAMVLAVGRQCPPQSSLTAPPLAPPTHWSHLMVEALVGLRPPASSSASSAPSLVFAHCLCARRGAWGKAGMATLRVRGVAWQRWRTCGCTTAASRLRLPALSHMCGACCVRALRAASARGSRRGARGARQGRRTAPARAPALHGQRLRLELLCLWLSGPLAQQSPPRFGSGLILVPFTFCRVSPFCVALRWHILH